jgi:hypothetical protein
MRQHVSSMALVALLVLLCAGMALAQSTNGSAGDMPAYYDGQSFTINLKEMPPNAENSLLGHNSQINTIYMAEGFIAVLDAIQGDGFNPLWREVDYSFNEGYTPVQLFSDTEIEQAAAAGVITLTPTNEVYRCSVVGPKK